MICKMDILESPLVKTVKNNNDALRFRRYSQLGFDQKPTRRWYHMFCFWKRKKKDYARDMATKIERLDYRTEVLKKELKILNLIVNKSTSGFFVREWKLDQEAECQLLDVVDGTYVYMKTKKTASHRAKTKKKGRK